MKIKSIALGLFATIAAVSTNAAELRPETTTLHRSAAQSDFRDVILKVGIWEVEEKLVQEIASWREYRCDYIPPDGSGNWYGFYNLPLASKASALSQAIAGMSYEEAKAIVYSRDGYFSTRPVHWNAFKDEIEKIEHNLDLPGLYWSVVYLNGDTNARNLGYVYGSRYGRAPSGLPEGANALAGQSGDFNNGGGSSPSDGNNSGDFNNGGGDSGSHEGDFNNGGGSGGDFNNPPPSYNCGYVDEYRLIVRPKKVEKLVETLTKRVDVYFEGGVLLSGETELVELTWDGKSEQAVLSAKYAINRYSTSVDSRGNVYRLKAEGRKAISPSKGDFSFNFNASSLKVTFTDSRSEELTKLSNGSYGLKASFKVVKRKGGMCPKDITVATVNQVVPSDGVIDVSTLMSEAAVQGTKYRIEGVSIERTGTEYFSGSVELGKTEYAAH